MFEGGAKHGLAVTDSAIPKDNIESHMLTHLVKNQVRKQRTSHPDSFCFCQVLQLCRVIGRPQASAKLIQWLQFCRMKRSFSTNVAGKPKTLRHTLDGDICNFKRVEILVRMVARILLSLILWTEYMNKMIGKCKDKNSFCYLSGIIGSMYDGHRLQSFL